MTNYISGHTLQNIKQAFNRNGGKRNLRFDLEAVTSKAEGCLPLLGGAENVLIEEHYEAGVFLSEDCM